MVNLSLLRWLILFMKTVQAGRLVKITLEIQMSALQQYELSTNIYLYWALNSISGFLASPLICLHFNLPFLIEQVKQNIQFVSIIIIFTSLPDWDFTVERISPIYSLWYRKSEKQHYGQKKTWYFLMIWDLILLWPKWDHFPYLETPESLILIDTSSLNITALNFTV